MPHGRPPSNPFNWGPFGFKLCERQIIEYKALKKNQAVQVKYDFFNGDLVTCNINETISKSEFIPVLMEYYGVLEDQMDFSPFFNSVFYVAPEEYYKVARTRQIEACAQSVHYFYQNIGDDECADEDELIQNFAARHKKILAHHKSDMKQHIEHPVATMAWRISCDKKEMDTLSRIALDELEGVADFLDSEGILVAREKLEFPEDVFSQEFEFDHAEMLLERNNGTDMTGYSISPTILPADKQRQFWDNVKTLSDVEQKERLFDLCTRIRHHIGVR